MQLHITLTSPYARMARVVVREKGLLDRVTEVVATTRQPGSPYYDLVRSGRVPALILPDGRVMEGSDLICDYLDALDAAPVFARPAGDARWDFAMAEARARSLLDGLAVLVRERYRPENERSPGIVAHEIARARRMLDGWQKDVEAVHLSGPLNYVQMLMVGVGEVVGRVPELTMTDWPELSRRIAAIAARPSFVDTAPPA